MVIHCHLTDEQNNFLCGEEVWMPIESFQPNRHFTEQFISNWGRVKRIKPSGFINIFRGNTNSDHYKTIGNNNITYGIHRLVLVSFNVSNVDNKPTVDHRDNNRQNNNITNLRWFTHIEQGANRFRSARTPGGVYLNGKKYIVVWREGGFQRTNPGFLIQQEAIDWNIQHYDTSHGI